MSKSKMRYLINIKICRRYPSKKETKRASSTLLNYHFDDRSGGFVHKNLDGSCSWSCQWSRSPWWMIQHEVIYISRTVISHLPVLELNVATRRWFDRIKKKKKRQKRVSQSDNKLIIWTCLCPLAGCKHFNYVLP